MQTPTITMLYAGLFTLLLLALSIQIIRLRWKFRVGIGTGEAKELERAVRIHGNFVEYVPITLVLMVLMELSGAGALQLHIIGAALFVARIAHAIGLTRSAGPTIYRTIGVLGTFLVLFFSAGYLLGFAVMRLLG